MYKKGRFWVFAGILAFGWQIAEGTAVHADETPVNNGNSQVAVAPTAVDSDKKSVTLTAGDSTNTKAQPDETGQSDSKVTPEVTGKSQISTDPQSDAVTGKSQQLENSKNDNLNQNEEQADPIDVQNPSSETETKDAGTSDTQTVNSDNQQEKTAATSNQISQNRQKMLKASVPTPEVTTIKGVNGTVNWSFDTSTGAMTLGGGTIGSPIFFYTDANNVVQMLQRSQIKSMAVTNELYITGKNGTYSGSIYIGLFSFLTNGVTGLDKVDVSQATDLSYMFMDSTMSKTVDLNGWDVRKVTEMRDMFSGAKGITDLELDDWQPDSLIDLLETFSSMDDLVTLNIADWNMSSVLQIVSPFSNDNKLSNLDVSKWNVSKVTSFNQAFYATPQLKKIDVSKWDVSNATNMEEMFLDSGVEFLDLSGWNMSKVQATDQIMGYAPGQVDFNIKELKVSSTFKLIQINQDWYSDIGQVTEYPYTGKWINEDTGEVLTYLELNALYENGTGGPAATYIAQVDESDRSKLTGQDITIYPNGALNLAAGVASLQDYQGRNISQQIDANQLSYAGNIDFSTIGVYPITLIYTSSLGNKFSVSINVNIVKHNSTATLGGQDVTIVLGPSAEDNAAMVQQKMSLLVDGLSDDGQKLDMSNLGSGKFQPIYEGYADGRPVTGPISYMEPAVLKFVFGYLNNDGVLLTHTSFLTLAKTKAAINLKEPTIVAGPTAKLNLADYFDSLDDALGNQMTDASAVTFTGVDQVDLTKAGDYSIDAAYTDSANNPITATTTVHVIKNTATLELVTPTPLIAGPATKFDPASVIKTAVTATGDEMSTTNGLKINSQVDPQKVGTYMVTVSYQDGSGNKLIKSVTVNVVPTKLALAVEPTVNVKSGQSYDPTTSVLTALDAFGQNVSADQLTYTGSVNTAIPGVYQLKMTNQDTFGNTVTKSITVTVVAEEAGEGNLSTPTPDTDTGTSADTVMANHDDPIRNSGAANVSTTTSQQTTRQQSAIKPTAIALQSQSQSSATKQAKTTTLPQTDDQRSALSLLGLGLLAATALVGLTHKRRRD